MSTHKRTPGSEIAPELRAQTIDLLADALERLDATHRMLSTRAGLLTAALDQAFWTSPGLCTAERVTATALPRDPETIGWSVSGYCGLSRLGENLRFMTRQQAADRVEWVFPRSVLQPMTLRLHDAAAAPNASAHSSAVRLRLPVAPDTPEAADWDSLTCSDLDLVDGLANLLTMQLDEDCGLPATLHGRLRAALARQRQWSVARPQLLRFDAMAVAASRDVRPVARLDLRLTRCAIGHNRYPTLHFRFSLPAPDASDDAIAVDFPEAGGLCAWRQTHLDKRGQPWMRFTLTSGGWDPALQETMRAQDRAVLAQLHRPLSCALLALGTDGQTPELTARRWRALAERLAALGSRAAEARSPVAGRSV